MKKTTKQLYGNTSFSRKREWISLVVLWILFGLAFRAKVQESSVENFFI